MRRLLYSCSSRRRGSKRDRCSCEHKRYLLSKQRQELLHRQSAVVLFLHWDRGKVLSGAGRDEVRLAYVLNMEDLAKALVVLEKALEEYKKVISL